MSLIVTAILLALNLTGEIQEDLYKNKLKDIFNNGQKEEVISSTFIFNENIPLDKELQEYIHKLSNEYDISENLFYAIVAVESNFNPNAISPTNDYGLIQLNKSSGTLDWVAEEIGLGENFKWDNPYHSAKAGFWYLRYLKNYWINQGNTNEEDLFYLLTTSFNRGISGTRRFIEKYGHPISTYSEKILDAKNRIEQKML